MKFHILEWKYSERELSNLSSNLLRNIFLLKVSTQTSFPNKICCQQLLTHCGDEHAWWQDVRNVYEEKLLWAIQFGYHSFHKQAPLSTTGRVYCNYGTSHLTARMRHGQAKNLFDQSSNDWHLNRQFFQTLHCSE